MGVPQGSVLGPSFFNIFLNDFIYVIEQSEVCNFADDNTIFLVATLEAVASSLEEDVSKLMYWFKTNKWSWIHQNFKLCYLAWILMKTVLEVSGCPINVANSFTLLGVTIDSKLKFNNHVSKICHKTNSKIFQSFKLSWWETIAQPL